MNEFLIKYCARCKTDIKIPSLTIELKNEINTVRKKQGMGSTLASIRKITTLDLVDSKILAIHINNAGHCNRCNYNELKGENAISPKCKAFNLNWG